MPAEADTQAFALPGLRPRQRHQTAIATANRHISVGELLDQAVLLSVQLRQQLSQRFLAGQSAPCVLVPSADVINYVTGLFACLHAGVQFVPLRPGAEPEQLAAIVGADALLSFQGNASSVTIDRHWDGCARGSSSDVVMMTSGTTGAPKGVALNLDALVLNATVAGTRLGVQTCDTWSVSIDPGLMSGLCHFIMAWQFDLPFHHLGEFPENAISDLFRTRITGFGGGPLQLVQIAQKFASTPPAVMVSSGDFFSSHAIESIRESCSKTKLNKLYGLTEVSGRMCCLNDIELNQSADAAGYPLPGYRVAISTYNDDVRELSTMNAGEIVEGEIVVRSPLLFAGYHQLDSGFLPTPAGWFATGDHGSMDSRGLITLRGRTDDVFKVGGEKVNRNQIEQALAPLMGKVEYVVLPLENHLLGHCPVLFVAAAESISIPGWMDIVTWLRERLPSRSIPVYMYEVGSQLPMLGSGKIDKQQLLKNHQSYKKISI